jgi:hypothetical protein
VFLEGWPLYRHFFATTQEQAAMTDSPHGCNRSSRIAGFHRKSPTERLDLIAAFAGLDEATARHLADMGNLAPALLTSWSRTSSRR